MTRRNYILELVQRHFKYSNSPIAIEVDDVDKDYNGISKLINKLSLNNLIGMSKDKDKSQIWFRRRK